MNGPGDWRIRGENLDLVAACEQRLVNCWPAVQTLIFGDWVVRFANGYSGRANSASALRAGAQLSDGEVAGLLPLFRAQGLTPAIRLSPLAEAGLEARLIAMGWRAVTHSIGMVCDTPLGEIDPATVIAPQPPEAWIAGISGWQEARKANPAHLSAIVGRILLPAAFASLREGGHDCAYGMAVVDRGMAEIGSIIVGPQARGRGLGRRLVSSLVGWAAGAGAVRVFLQVEASNAPARALYASLGFRDVYSYTEYRLV